MHVAPNGLQDTFHYSGSGQCLINHRELIISLWRKRLREGLNAASNLHNAVLVDTVPLFLENIAQSLSPAYPRSTATDKTTIAQEHGRERAFLTDYNIDQLVREYRILREVIIEVLDEKCSISKEDRNIINSSIDGAIQDAVAAFGLAQSEIRERFIAMISHDIRNPLNTAMMAAELIELEPDNPSSVSDLAARIVYNLTRIERMTRDILDVTVAKAHGRLKLELSECDMLAIAKSIISDHELKGERSFVLNGPPTKGIWSPDALQRALENLIVNAINYGSSNKPITVTISAQHDRVSVSVHNEGKPIPQEEQETIFEVYRRTQTSELNNRMGWGIGLPLVRTIVESMGGIIHIDSSSERGTTFTMDLPLDARPFQQIL